MKSSNKKIKYVSLDQSNFEQAYEIQKLIWPADPDYQDFSDKVNAPIL